VPDDAAAGVKCGGRWNAARRKAANLTAPCYYIAQKRRSVLPKTAGQRFGYLPRVASYRRNSARGRCGVDESHTMLATSSSHPISYGLRKLRRSFLYASSHGRRTNPRTGSCAACDVGAVSRVSRRMATMPLDPKKHRALTMRKRFRAGSHRSTSSSMERK